MHRINSPGATPDNRFKTTPAPATRVTDVWLNTIQDELEKVVVDPTGGALALDAGDNGQLLAAIKIMIDRAIAEKIEISDATATLRIDTLIIKRGGGTVGYNAFPSAFPDYCDRVFITWRSNVDDNDESDETFWVSTRDKDGFTVSVAGDFSAGTFDWLAFGY